MSSSRRFPSEPPDYYSHLGIPPNANRRQIKHAFARLAKKFHPDKKAPGQNIDAYEFRKIHEAYENLFDDAKRAKHDEQLAVYRAWKRVYDKEEEERRAEERERAAREQAEREKQAAEAEMARKKQEQERAAREEEQQKRQREEKIRMAEERSRQAAQRAREQQEQAARERLRMEKEQEAERKTREAARRAQLSRQKMAEERLKAIRIEEKQNTLRQNWAKMREAVETRDLPGDATQSQGTPKTSLSVCPHPRFGWPKMKGTRECMFCGTCRTNWSYRCPSCDIAACPGCKEGYYRQA